MAYPSRVFAAGTQRSGASEGGGVAPRLTDTGQSRSGRLDAIEGFNPIEGVGACAATGLAARHVAKRYLPEPLAWCLATTAAGCSAWRPFDTVGRFLACSVRKPSSEQ